MVYDHKTSSFKPLLKSNKFICSIKVLSQVTQLGLTEKFNSENAPGIQDLFKTNLRCKLKSSGCGKKLVNDKGISGWIIPV